MFEIDNFFIITFYKISYDNMKVITEKKILKEKIAFDKKEVRKVIKREFEDGENLTYSVQEIFEYKQKYQQSEDNYNFFPS